MSDDPAGLICVLLGFALALRRWLLFVAVWWTLDALQLVLGAAFDGLERLVYPDTPRP